MSIIRGYIEGHKLSVKDAVLLASLLWDAVAEETDSEEIHAILNAPTQRFDIDPARPEICEEQLEDKGFKNRLGVFELFLYRERVPEGHLTLGNLAPDGESPGQLHFEIGEHVLDRLITKIEEANECGVWENGKPPFKDYKLSFPHPAPNKGPSPT